MFVVLKIVSPEKSLSRKRKQRKIFERSQINPCPSTNALPFFTLDVPDEKRGINWDKVAEKCGRYSSRIVAPRSCPLPDHSRLKRFIPIYMNSLLIFNTAADTIKNAALSPENLCITVTDRTAVHYKKICSLLPLATCIRVITSHPERYAEACVKAYEEYGASIIIRNSYEAVTKPEIVVCSDGAVSPAMKNSVIFSSKRKNAGSLIIHGSGIALTKKHLETVGNEIDSVDFAGALTELCGSSEYRNSVFEKIETNCRNCEYHKAEKCLSCRLFGMQPE